MRSATEEVILQLVTRVSRLMQMALGEPLTLDEEDTLAAILTQWAPRQLIELACVTKGYIETNSSDSSSKALAWNTLTAILAPNNGDNPLAHWANAVQIRTQVVKGAMSAADTRTLLERGGLAQAEIDKLTPVSKALETEINALSSKLKWLETQIAQDKISQEKTQVMLDEISVPMQ